jgi:hypothetical protein
MNASPGRLGDQEKGKPVQQWNGSFLSLIKLIKNEIHE